MQSSDFGNKSLRQLSLANSYLGEIIKAHRYADLFEIAFKESNLMRDQF